MEARFLELQGRVETKASGSSEWQRAEPGGLIRENAVISTGLQGSAVIGIGSSRLEVGPLTLVALEELALRSAGEETTLYLRIGRIRALVTPPRGQNIDFTVRSPIAAASVRGTSFEFDGSRLRVEDGLVLLTGSAGQKVYVAATLQSYVDENNQNRIVPPFEAEAARLRPVIPELNHTGSGTEPPETGGIFNSSGTRIYIGWP
ncbi:MAG: FecR family protein [Treponema sp.]|nr:FecR family protein [Treponema sp.]